MWISTAPVGTANTLLLSILTACSFYPHFGNGETEVLKHESPKVTRPLVPKLGVFFWGHTAPWWLLAELQLLLYLYYAQSYGNQRVLR